MNLYVVETGEYSERDIFGVFGDLLAAKKSCENRFTLDPSTWEDHDDAGWWFHPWPSRVVAIYKMKLDEPAW